MLLERSQAAFRQLDAARAELRGSIAGPSGAVALAVPPAAGRWLVPPLAEAMATALSETSTACKPRLPSSAEFGAPTALSTP